MYPAVIFACVQWGAVRGFLVKRDCLFLFCVIRDHDKLKSVNREWYACRDTWNHKFIFRKSWNHILIFRKPWNLTRNQQFFYVKINLPCKRVCIKDSFVCGAHCVFDTWQTRQKIEKQLTGNLRLDRSRLTGLDNKKRQRHHWPSFFVACVCKITQSVWSSSRLKSVALVSKLWRATKVLKPYAKLKVSFTSSIPNPLDLLVSSEERNESQSHWPKNITL